MLVYDNLSLQSLGIALSCAVAGTEFIYTAHC